MYESNANTLEQNGQSSDVQMFATSGSMDTNASGSFKPDSSDAKPEGTVIMELHNLSELDSAQSSFVWVADLPWTVRVMIEPEYKHNFYLKHLTFMVHCNKRPETALWSCEASFTITLRSQVEGKRSYKRHYSASKFNYFSTSWWLPHFIDFNELQNPLKGYVKKNKAVVEVSITVEKAHGARIIPAIDFTHPQGRLSDAILVINGDRLYVDKSYLARHSPVFEALFYGDGFSEDIVEVPLENVIVDQFKELLSVIYPSRQMVHSRNVEFLLELGNRFEMKFVMNACENYLVRSVIFPAITKLTLSDRYEMIILRDACISSFTKIDDLKSLKKTKGYEQLKDGTKLDLLERMVQLK